MLIQIRCGKKEKGTVIANVKPGTETKEKYKPKKNETIGRENAELEEKVKDVDNFH